MEESVLKEYFNTCNEAWRLIKTYFPYISNQEKFWDVVVEDAANVAYKSQFASDLVQAVLREMERNVDKD